jgi:hypothetical protein
MRAMVDDKRQSDRLKSWLPFGLRRRPAEAFVAPPERCPASPLLASARRRSQRGPREVHPGLLGF